VFYKKARNYGISVTKSKKEFPERLRVYFEANADISFDALKKENDEESLFGVLEINWQNTATIDLKNLESNEIDIYDINDCISPKLGLTFKFVHDILMMKKEGKKAFMASIPLTNLVLAASEKEFRKELEKMKENELINLAMDIASSNSFLCIDNLLVNKFYGYDGLRLPLIYTEIVLEFLDEKLHLNLQKQQEDDESKCLENLIFIVPDIMNLLCRKHEIEKKNLKDGKQEEVEEKKEEVEGEPIIDKKKTYSKRPKVAKQFQIKNKKVEANKQIEIIDLPQNLQNILRKKKIFL